MARSQRRATSSRALCLSQGHLLLVEHCDPLTLESYWLLPGGWRERGETLASAAMREVREETGIDVRVVRRLTVPADVVPGTYALFEVEPREHVAARPLVDLAIESYLTDAAWFPVSVDDPLGPLSSEYWGFLAQQIRRLLRQHPAPQC